MKMYEFIGENVCDLEKGCIYRGEECKVTVRLFGKKNPIGCLVGMKDVVEIKSFIDSSFINATPEEIKFKEVEISNIKEFVNNEITNPGHYCFSNIEPIQVIQEWKLNFCLGNAIKYIARAGKKGDKLEDLKKAKQYLEFEIKRMENVE